MSSRNNKRSRPGRVKQPKEVAFSSSPRGSSASAGGGFTSGEQGYRLLFECNPQPMYVYDRNTLRFLAVNDAAVQRYGFSREEFLRMTIKDIRPPEDIPAFLKDLARLPARGLDNAGHWRHRKRDGSIIDVEIVTHPLVFGGKRGKLVVAMDITARKRAEAALQQAHDQLEQRVAERTAALRKSEENHRRLLEMSPDAIFVKRGDCVSFINSSGMELFGARHPDEILGRSVSDLFHPDYQPLIQEHLRRLRQPGRSVPLVEEKIVRLDGTIRYVEMAVSHFTDHGGRATLVVLRDCSERKRLEAEILASIEREQERIGRDLHDGLCQILVGAKFRSAYLGKLLNPKFPEEAREATALEQSLSQAIEQSRDLARGLNPVKVAPDGLESALQKLAAGVERSSRLRCICHIPRAVKVRDHNVANQLYRIAQEAVQNAVKHAGARNISIALTRHNAHLSLAVKDDGAGLPVRFKRSGMGLDNMRTRAGLIGGLIEIRRRKTGGTAVICVLSATPEPKRR